jgi:hypothetical protein
MNRPSTSCTWTNSFEVDRSQRAVLASFGVTCVLCSPGILFASVYRLTLRSPLQQWAVKGGRHVCNIVTAERGYL